MSAADPARIAMIARRYARLPDVELEARLANIVVLLSAPRSGSTLLFDLLSRSRQVLTIGGETHAVYRQFPHLAAENPEFDSGMLDARHADPETVRMFRCMFLAMLRNNQGRLLHDLPGRSTAEYVIVEKTPRNALNLPFLKHVFPNARYVFLHRNAAETIASLIEGWETGARTGRFVTYRKLPGWDREQWCFVLPRGWRALIGKPLADICAFQWNACNDQILADLGDAPMIGVSYQALIDAPEMVLTALGERLNIAGPWQQWRDAALPTSASTVSPPSQGKWRLRAAEVDAVLPSTVPTARRIESRLGSAYR